MIFSAKPSYTGTKAYQNIDLEKIIPFIDWKPFFDVWQIRGKYPNRNYPRIFEDSSIGAEALKLFNVCDLS